MSACSGDERPAIQRPSASPSARGRLDRPSFADASPIARHNDAAEALRGPAAIVVTVSGPTSGGRNHDAVVRPGRM